MVSTSQLPPTIYSRSMDEGWRKFLEAGAGVNSPETRAAYVAGWTAMYANLSERVK